MRPDSGWFTVFLDAWDGVGVANKEITLSLIWDHGDFDVTKPSGVVITDSSFAGFTRSEFEGHTDMQGAFRSKEFRFTPKSLEVPPFIFLAYYTHRGSTDPRASDGSAILSIP